MVAAGPGAGLKLARTHTLTRRSSLLPNPPQTQPPEGCSASPVSEDNLYHWTAQIFGPEVGAEELWQGKPGNCAVDTPRFFCCCMETRVVAPHMLISLCCTVCFDVCLYLQETPWEVSTHSC